MHKLGQYETHRKSAHLYGLRITKYYKLTGPLFSLFGIQPINMAFSGFAAFWIKLSNLVHNGRSTWVPKAPNKPFPIYFEGPRV